MKLSRRQFVALSTSAAFVGMAAPFSMEAHAATATEEAIKAFTGGAEAKSGRVSLNTPEIAENGNTVPVSVSVESEMSDADHVTDVLILADGNPRPGVATFKFTTMSGEAEASTRIRLAKTQNIVAVAKMSDGSFYMDKKQVKVTIGGCGG